MNDLLKALEPFAKAWDAYGDKPSDDTPINGNGAAWLEGRLITFGDLRRAREAFSGGGESGELITAALIDKASEAYNRLAMIRNGHRQCMRAALFEIEGDLRAALSLPSVRGDRDAVIEQCARAADQELGSYLCPYGRDRPGDKTWNHTDTDICPVCGVDGIAAATKCHDNVQARIAARIRALKASPVRGDEITREKKDQMTRDVVYRFMTARVSERLGIIEKLGLTDFRRSMVWANDVERDRALFAKIKEAGLVNQFVEAVEALKGSSHAKS